MGKTQRAVAAVFALALASCASKSGTGQEPEAPAHEGAADDDQQCQSNLDCPEGHACGFDPSRSKVVRYCTPE